MEWLRELLKAEGMDDAKIEAIIGNVNKELPKHFVPKSQYSDVVDARKKAEKEVTDRDKQLEELKKSSGDADALKLQIQKLQDDNKTAKEKYEAEATALKRNTAVKLALAGKVHDPDIVLGQLDTSKIELDDNGNVKTGLDDQIKALQTSKAFLFVPEDKGNQFQFRGTHPPEGGGAGGGGGKSSVGADFAKAANESGKAPTNANNPWD
ncbi:phage scaffolding protein [Enterobacter ludwigii]|uniref:phage scaffolding protein n=1 Tax=Enterobacter ludwigii TaxID=299767 RepID=UPI003F708E89